MIAFLVSLITALTRPIFDGPIGRFFIHLLPYLQAVRFVWGRVYIPALVAIITTIVFWRLPQFSEIYVEFALSAFQQNGSGPSSFLVNVFRAIVSVSCLWLAGLAIWYFARLSLLDDDEPVHTKDKDTSPEDTNERPNKLLAAELWILAGIFFRNPDTFKRGLCTWVPRILGMMPSLGVFGGAIRAISSRTGAAIAETDHTQIMFELEALVIMGITAAGIAFSILIVQIKRHATLSTLSTWLRSLLPLYVPFLFMILLFNVFDGQILNIIQASDRTPTDLLILAYGAVLLAASIQMLTFSIGLCLGRSEKGEMINGLPWPKELMLAAVPATLGVLFLIFTQAVAGLVDGFGAAFKDTTGIMFPSETISSIFLFFILIWGISWAMKRRYVLPEYDKIRLKVKWDGENGTDLRSLGTFIGVIFCVIGIALPYDDVSVTATQWLGPISIVGLYTIAAAGIGALLMSWGRRHTLPIVGLVLVLPFVVALEHHFIRTQPAVAGHQPSNHDTVTAGFEAWQKARPGKCDTPIIVAAQGGGHFAAHHLAFLLAKTQDEAARNGFDFAECIFAISGISGGSVGAGPFAAALDLTRRNNLTELPDPKNQICPEGTDPSRCHLGPVTRLVHAALRQDLLSPLGARMLFSDVLGNYFPASYFDRSRALDGAVLHGLRSGYEDELSRRGQKPAPDYSTLLSTQIFDAWSPEAGRGPALFLNTVDVSSGQRLVMSPFRLVREGRTPMTYAQFVEECRNDWEGLMSGDVEAPNVGTAMFMSARFPFFTPPAAIDVGGGCQAPQVIDGGTFDNSGVETARDIIAAIQSSKKFAGQQFALLVVGFENSAKPIEISSGRLPMDEVLAPAAAFFKSWRVRTIRSKELVDAYYSSNLRLCGPVGAPERCGEVMVFKNRLPDEAGREFTLSWLLSSRTFDRIADSTGVWSAFRDDGLIPPAPRLKESVAAFSTRETTFQNTCDLRHLFKRIMPKDYEGPAVTTAACP